MNILCLTGWQQPHDALKEIAPGALHFDYASFGTVETAFAGLPAAPDCAVGWSLGGQLLVRAIAGGYMRPSRLILLAATFQCVADGHYPHGITREMFGGLCVQYRQNPQEMLQQFQGFSGFGCRNIVRQLSRDISLWPNGLFWLEELGRASCRALDFSGFPETVIVHGTADKVTDPAQAEAFAARIPRSRRVLLPEYSHALHLHDPQYFRDLIENRV